ncbi:hypothetical protein Btru_038278 [Bulinus truncatus]|nr:hypothetical protein Btru_038278 [Bulinus truncatus]
MLYKRLWYTRDYGTQETMVHTRLCYTRGYGTHETMLHKSLWYTRDYGTQEAMVHTRLCYTRDYVTQEAMVHTRLCYTRGYGTHETMLHKRLCYTRDYVTQDSKLVQVLRQWYRDTDPFRPPVELPVPEHIHTTAPPPCGEDEIAASQCGKSSNSQESSPSASSCYTTTKSGGSKHVNEFYMTLSVDEFYMTLSVDEIYMTLSVDEIYMTLSVDEFYMTLSVDEFYMTLSVDEFYMTLSVDEIYMTLSVDEIYITLSVDEFYMTLSVDEFYMTLSVDEIYMTLSVDEIYMTLSVDEFYMTLSVDEIYMTLSVDEFYMTLSVDEFYMTLSVDEFYMTLSVDEIYITLSVDEIYMTLSVDEIYMTLSVDEFYMTLSVDEIYMTLSVDEFYMTLSVDEIYMTLSVDEFYMTLSVDEFYMTFSVDEIYMTLSVDEIYMTLSVDEFYMTLSVDEIYMTLSVDEIYMTLSVDEFYMTLSVDEFYMTLSVDEFYMTLSVDEIYMTLSVDEIYITLSVDEIYMTLSVDEIYMTLSVDEFYMTLSVDEIYMTFVSVQTVDTRKTNTIALVVLVVSVLVIAGIIAGVVLHIHMDSGILSSSKQGNTLNSNRLSTKEKEYMYKVVSGKIFPKQGSPSSKNNQSSYATPSNRQFSSDSSHSPSNRQFSSDSSHFSNNSQFSSDSSHFSSNRQFSSDSSHFPSNRQFSSDSSHFPSNRQFSSDSSHSVHGTISSNINENHMTTGQHGQQHITRSQDDSDRTPTQVTRSQTSPAGHPTDINRGQTDHSRPFSPVTQSHGRPDETFSHSTRTASDFTGSRPKTRSSGGRTDGVSPIFSTRRNDEDNGDAFFDPTSSRSSATSLGNFPITTLDPLEPQREIFQENTQSQPLESNFNSPDLDPDPYFRATDGIERLRGRERITVSRNLFHVTSGSSPGSTQFTRRDPGMTSSDQPGSGVRSDQLTRAAKFDLTTVTSSSETAINGEDFIGSSSAQQTGRTTNTRTHSWSASSGTTMSLLTGGGSRSPTFGAYENRTSRFPVTNQPSTAVNMDVFRFSRNSTTQQQLNPSAGSPRMNKITSNGERQRRFNSTVPESKFRQSSGSSSKNSAVRTTTSRVLARPSVPNTTKRWRRLMTPVPRTTPMIRSEALEQFASLYGGGNADGFDGPALEGSNSGVKEGEMGMDYDFILRDMPPPEVLPTAIATKIAAAPPALTTLPPPRTPKPPKIIIITRDVVAEIGMSVSQGLKVGCMAKEAWGWTYMAISRYEGDHNLSLEFLGGVEKRDEWPFIPIDSRMSDFTLHRDDEMVHLVLETKFAMCEDKGRYLCEVSVNRTFFSQAFNVDVKKKPEKPILSFPDDIFSGQKVWITTTWDAGNPMTGHIVHDIIKGYTDLPFESTDERTTSWYKDCAIMVENRYSVTPELSWNGTEIIARIEAEKTATSLQKSIIERLKFDRKAMIVLDNKMCQGKLGDKLPHPYNSLKFVTCSPNGPTVEICPEDHQYDAKLKKCFQVATKKTTS